ncbi:hypothetical protein ACWCXX_03060 [Streptomyces sp. NPDC001732]
MKPHGASVTVARFAFDENDTTLGVYVTELLGAGAVVLLGTVIVGTCG